MSKAFESIFSERLMTHLYSNLLISQEQHGFVKGRNCQTNILSCLEDWTKAVDENDSVDVIYFDYEKAFDKVSHSLLLEKLKWYGIEGKTFDWIKSFLMDRVQRVKIGNAKSTWRAVLSSVVQGSVLGVNLFVVYINDLPANCLLPKHPNVSSSASGYDDVRNGTKIKLLADDTKAYQRIRKGREAEDTAALQETVDKIQEWAEMWQMKIHPDKTKVLHIGSNNPRHTYMINETEIESCEVQRDIGFMIHESLSTSHHVQNARSRALMEIGIMRRTFDYIDRRSFNILYNQKIRTHLEWGAIACPPITKSESFVLERVQDKATHLVNNLRSLNSDERRENLGLFHVSYRRLRGDLIEVYKLLTKRTKMDHGQFWEVRDSRTGPMLVKDQLGPTCTGQGRKQRRNFFAYRVIKPWNWLPKELKIAPSINSFKNGLDNLMKTERWKKFVQQL